MNYRLFLPALISVNQILFHEQKKIKIVGSLLSALLTEGFALCLVSYSFVFFFYDFKFHVFALNQYAEERTKRLICPSRFCIHKAKDLNSTWPGTSLSHHSNQGLVLSNIVGHHQWISIDPWCNAGYKCKSKCLIHFLFIYVFYHLSCAYFTFRPFLAITSSILLAL